MPLLRVLQVSDLHAGTREEPEVEGDLRTLVRETEPELVIASGDLAHRNTPEQHNRAARLLRSLERPLLVIPGNHDIPRWPPWRFTRTFAELQRHWPELEPVYRSERLVVCGLNSVRPWKQQGGALRPAQLEHVAGVLADAPAGALRGGAARPAASTSSRRTSAPCGCSRTPGPREAGRRSPTGVFRAERRLSARS